MPIRQNSSCMYNKKIMCRNGQAGVLDLSHVCVSYSVTFLYQLRPRENICLQYSASQTLKDNT